MIPPRPGLFLSIRTGTGGFGFHGPYEHITAENMDLVTEILLNLVRIFAEQAE